MSADVEITALGLLTSCIRLTGYVITDGRSSPEFLIYYYQLGLSMVCKTVQEQHHNRGCVSAFRMQHGANSQYPDDIQYNSTPIPKYSKPQFLNCKLIFDSLFLFCNTHTQTHTHTGRDSVWADVGYAIPPAVQMEVQITGLSYVY